MSIEADFYNTNAKFKSLEIDCQDGYMKNYLYKIVWQSAVLSGAEIGQEGAETLFETGCTSTPSRLSDYEMLYGLFRAYKAASEFAKTNKVLTFNDVNGFWLLCTKYIDCESGRECFKTQELSDFCEQMNIKCQNVQDMQPWEKYLLTFEAYFEIFELLPWSVANYRMARLMSHFFQLRFSLFPTNFLGLPLNKDQMSEMHIKSLNAEISEFLKKTGD